jgi:hypothetical protein
MGKARSISASICIHIRVVVRRMYVETAFSVTSNLRMTKCFSLAMAGYRIPRLLGTSSQALRVHKGILFVTHLCILGVRLVQSTGAGCSNYGNQARYCITGRMTLELIRIPSSSFACANFISTAATIGTNYKLNSHKTIGIYAAVLTIAQGTT